MKISFPSRSSLIVGLVFFVVILGLFSVYTSRTLGGDINKHILSSEMFGIPSELRERGLEPFAKGPKDAGWDGQFYYYMSNDLLARKDASQHIDSPSYRYQRVGLSLYAAIVATLTGQDWVSPATFFFAYLALITGATIVGAQLISRLGGHPALILLWSFSVGTQLTLFNALPDAAADAFLILALAALFARRIAWSIIPFTFAALSREVYAIFPSAVLFFMLFSVVCNKAGVGLVQRVMHRLFEGNVYLLLVPGLVAVAWNIYVTRHFGIPPSAQAFGILGLPLVAWVQSYLTALHSGPPGSGLAFGSTEAVSLVLFLFVLAVASYAGIRAVLSRTETMQEEFRGIAACTLLFVVLYASFGPTVTGHYTGYFKAAAVFFYLIPLILVTLRINGFWKYASYAILVISLIYTNSVNLRVRVLASAGGDDRYTKMSTVVSEQREDCFKNYQADVHVNKITILNSSLWGRLFGRESRAVINVALTNSGNTPFISTRAFGSVFMSFHWVDRDGKAAIDGVRSALTKPLLPGQTTNVDVITDIPSQPGLALRLSPVQEGCAWFYQANPLIGRDFVLNTDK